MPLLKNALDRLNKQVQRVPLPPYLHGGIPGLSNTTNAQSHVRRPMLICADIKDFFPSIDKSRVEDVFRRKLKCSAKVSKALAKICTFRGSLPTGSKVSSSIANFAILDLAFQLNQLARKHNGTFTQYVDDIAISGPFHIGQLGGLVQRIIEKNGFVCHPEKMKVLASADEHVVTGVRVDRGTDIPQQYLRDLKALLADTARRSAAGTLLTPKELNSLRGKIGYVKGLNPGAGKTLCRKLDSMCSTEKHTLIAINFSGY